MFDFYEYRGITRASSAQINQISSAQCLLQLLSLQVPFNLADTAYSHEPKRLVITSRPREILNRVIGLDSDKESAIAIQDIDALARPGHDVAVPGNFQPIRDPVLREVYRPFVEKVHGIVADVVRVDHPLPGRVELSSSRSKRHGDGTGDSASIGNVHRLLVRGQGDSVRLDQAILDYIHRTSAGPEAVSGRLQLRCSICECVEPGVFYTMSALL